MGSCCGKIYSRLCSALQWHNIQTMFRGSRRTLSEVETGTHLMMASQFHFFSVWRMNLGLKYSFLLVLFPCFGNELEASGKLRSSAEKGDTTPSPRLLSISYPSFNGRNKWLLVVLVVLRQVALWVGVQAGIFTVRISKICALMYTCVANS
jgi:hypothetical protein